MDDQQVVINIDEGDVDDSTHVGAPSPPIPTNAEKCLASIEDKLSSLSRDTIGYGTLCIYKVPEKHRNKNQEAYAPRLISVGLVHHGESQLQAMEEYKLKYLNNFLRTFRVSLQELVRYVDGEEKLVCGCYEDIYSRNLLEKSKLPSEVILLDGIFVVELFLKNHFVQLREKGDIMFDNPWVSNEILHDLMLFENQLPYRFLNKLYDKFVSNKVGKWLDDHTINPPSFDELAHKYFKDVGNTGKLPLMGDFQYARHFVEFLSILHMPREQKRFVNASNHVVVHHFGKKMDYFARCPTATELKAAGVKFQKGLGNCLLDIQFDDKNGVLMIPSVTVNNSTETFFRNQIAFEQSGYHLKHTTSFVIFLDNLIDTRKDVEILMQHGIIRNELGSSEQVAELFDTVYKEFVADPKEFYFIQECKQLNDYSRDWWHGHLAEWTKSFAVLKRDYFSSPWSVISLIAAVIVLGLTATQTAYSILQVKNAH